MTFTDVLGDQQFNLYAASVSHIARWRCPTPNLARRFQYSLQGFSQTHSSTGTWRLPLRPVYPLHRSRSARWRRTPSAAERLRHLSVQPLRASRAERPASISSSRNTTMRRCSCYANQYQQQLYGQPLFRNGTMHAAGRRVRAARRPCSVSTGRSRATRCASGTTSRRRLAGSLSRQTADVDAR